jgi:transcriptional regulator with XRE-family HTH domain
MSSVAEAFGAALTSLRERLDISRYRLAQDAGVSLSAVLRYEKGEQWPQKETIGLLVRGLRINAGSAAISAEEVTGLYLAAGYVPPYPEYQQYLDETRDHIAAVQDQLGVAIDNLRRRQKLHDASKLHDPEAKGFMAMGSDARLQTLTYGSAEYMAVLREHKPTIAHHYDQNDHHPEYWKTHRARDISCEQLTPDGEVATNGAALISQMTLPALVEMLCDWRAAGKRMKGGGDMLKSIEINTKRFQIHPQLVSILVNTAYELGMVEEG